MTQLTKVSSEQEIKLIIRAIKTDNVFASSSASYKPTSLEEDLKQVTLPIIKGVEEGKMIFFKIEINTAFVGFAIQKADNALSVMLRHVYFSFKKEIINEVTKLIKSYEE